MQTKYFLLIGLVFILIGAGMTFYNETSKVWHLGEGTDFLDDKTWVIKNQSIGFATPWSYDLGVLPAGTRIFARFNVTTVENRTNVARPGLTRHIITNVDTGEVIVSFDMDSVRVLPNPITITPTRAHYKYTVQSVYPVLHEATLDPTPVEFNACIQAYELRTVYPYRIVGAPMLIIGIALIAFSKIKKEK